MTTSTANEYWQSKGSYLTRKIVNQFKLSNISQDKQCFVINAALKGQRSLYEQDLKWKVTRKEDGNCEVELASRLGSLTVYKVSSDQTTTLQQEWMENSVRHYQDLFDLNSALNARLNDVKELYDESKRNLKDIQARYAEAYFTNLNKYTQLLNAKKAKIRKLLGTDEEKNVTIDHLQIRKRPNENTESQLPKMRSKKQKITKASSQPLYVKPKRFNVITSSLSSHLRKEDRDKSEDEDEDDIEVSDSDLEDDLFTQTSSQLPSQLIPLTQPQPVPQEQLELTDKVSALPKTPSLPSSLLPTDLSETPQLSLPISEHDPSERLTATDFDKLFFDTDDEEEALLFTKTS
ncbi:hypothetical protein G6F37_007456 [Rhizopus arrhizus]|nr:hypothetical protein G6F37_007456 [Rhizopus arrhizus]